MQGSVTMLRALVRQVLDYVGSSTTRAGILAFLCAWGVLLEVVLVHQDALLKLISPTL